MIAAIVLDWDDKRKAGLAKGSDGEMYAIRYEDGQSFFISDEVATPELTGRHAQVAGGELKLPRVGDPILIRQSAGQTGTVWGYLRHYLDLAERRYGTEFLQPGLQVAA